MPETAAGLLLVMAYADPETTTSVVFRTVEQCEAEARALGRAEALAAVRAAVEGLPNTSAPCPDDECRYVYLRGVLAAIDNLETP